MRRCLLALCLSLCVAFVLPAPQTRRVSLPEIKKGCEVFEGVLNTTLRQAFPHPLLLAEKARGCYLEGYGVTFRLSVNLNRAYLLFRPNQKSKDSVDEAQSMAALRQKLTEVLWQYGSGLSPLPSGSKISIIAHVLSRSPDMGTETARVLILTVTGRDLETARATPSLEEFRKKVKYVEY